MLRKWRPLKRGLTLLTIFLILGFLLFWGGCGENPTKTEIGPNETARAYFGLKEDMNVIGIYGQFGASRPENWDTLTIKFHGYKEIRGREIIAVKVIEDIHAFRSDSFLIYLDADNEGLKLYGGNWCRMNNEVILSHPRLVCPLNPIVGTEFTSAESSFIDILCHHYNIFSVRGKVVANNETVELHGTTLTGCYRVNYTLPNFGRYIQFMKGNLFSTFRVGDYHASIWYKSGMGFVKAVPYYEDSTFTHPDVGEDIEYLRQGP